MDDYDFIANIKESYMKEDGMVGMAVPGPTNVVGTGAIAGSGGKGGEPGVNLKKKNKVVLQPMRLRAPPRM
jgi:hypothetical protein